MRFRHSCAALHEEQQLPQIACRLLECSGIVGADCGFDLRVQVGRFFPILFVQLLEQLAGAFDQLLSLAGDRTPVVVRLEIFPSRGLDSKRILVDHLVRAFGIFEFGVLLLALARGIESLQTFPGLGNFGFALALQGAGNSDVLGQARALFDGSSQPMTFEGYALAKSGKQAEARVVLQELLKRSADRYVPAYYIALIYCGLDQRNEAVAWLERGYEQRDPRMAFLKVEPKWNDLRDEPGFQSLLRRVGFTS